MLAGLQTLHYEQYSGSFKHRKQRSHISPRYSIEHTGNGCVNFQFTVFSNNFSKWRYQSLIAKWLDH